MKRITFACDDSKGLDAPMSGRVKGTVPCAHDHEDSCGGSGH